jgi:hypothetical protein
MRHIQFKVTVKEGYKQAEGNTIWLGENLRFQISWNLREIWNLRLGP